MNSNNMSKRIFTITSFLTMTFCISARTYATSVSSIDDVDMDIEININIPKSTEPSENDTIQIGSTKSVSLERDKNTDLEKSIIVEKINDNQEEISDLKKLDFATAYKQLRELYKISCDFDKLKNADVESYEYPISGITFYEKLYAQYNHLLDFALKPTQNFLLACSRMIDFLCQENKNIRYLIHVPNTMGCLLNDKNLFNNSEMSKTFSIKFFDELWLSKFLCITDGVDNSPTNVYSLERYDNWDNIKENSQKQYIMDLITYKIATLYELILNKLYTTDYLLEDLVIHEASSYDFLVDSFVFKKRNVLLTGVQELYNGFRDDIVNAWLLKLKRFLSELRSLPLSTIQNEILPYSKKEFFKWRDLSRKIYKDLKIDTKLKGNAIHAFCKELLQIISQNPKLVKEQISSTWNQWLILSFFLLYKIEDLND